MLCTEAERVMSRKRRFLAMAYCGAVATTCAQSLGPVWSQSQRWWVCDVIGFTKTDFIQNFRTPRHTFDHICLWLSTRLQRTLRKCVGVGLYQLATVAGYTVLTDGRMLCCLHPLMEGVNGFLKTFWLFCAIC